MFINNYEIPRPPDSVLDRCHQVLIGDPAFKYWRMKNWCFEQELSLVYAEMLETADISPDYDHVVAFYFAEGRDATVFSLKFK